MQSNELQWLRWLARRLHSHALVWYRPRWLARWVTGEWGSVKGLVTVNERDSVYECLVRDLMIATCSTCDPLYSTHRPTIRTRRTMQCRLPFSISLLDDWCTQGGACIGSSSSSSRHAASTSSSEWRENRGSTWRTSIVFCYRVISFTLSEYFQVCSNK